MAEVIVNSMLESTELDYSDKKPQEIAELLQSHVASGAPAINNEDVHLICNLFPCMVEDDNQPLPKNIPAMAEQQDDDPQSFSEVGSTLGVATGVSMVAGRTMCTSASSMRCLQQSNK